MFDKYASCIMTVYKESQEHLREAMDSILRQTFSQFEFLVVLDGVERDLSSMVHQYANSDSRIRVIDHANMGLTNSLNAALKVAKGRYIFRQDADDVSYKARFEKQISEMSKLGLGVCGSCVEYFDSNRSYGIQSRLHSRMANFLNLSLRNTFTHGSLCFDRMKFDNGAFKYNEKFRYAQDFELMRRIRWEVNIGNCKETLYRYRINPNSITAMKAFQQNYYALCCILGIDPMFDPPRIDEHIKSNALLRYILPFYNHLVANKSIYTSHSLN